MGQIHLEIMGSFPNPSKHMESAEIGGHAAAIGRMVEYLLQQLPTAIQKDHDLHMAGIKPPRADFGHRRAAS